MADETSNEQLSEFLGEKPRPRWRRWLKWGLVLLGVVLLALLVAHCTRGAKPAEYATQPVQRGNLTVDVSATGKLAPTNQVTVGSQLSGLVTKVLVDVNDHVTLGQPLAIIDPEQIEDQIRAAQATLSANAAQVNQAQATLAESRAQLNRLEEVYKLSNGRVPSQTELQTGRADYQRAQAALKVAQANVASGRAQLGQFQTQRARAVIHSPVSGVVLARQVDPGQTVAASFSTPTLFVIAEDLSQMKLEVAIDEADVGEVQVGQKATFSVDAFPGKTFPATITRVDLGSNQTVSSATSTTTTTSTTGQVVSYAADLSVSNPSLQLRPGMTATATIQTAARNNVLLVPNAALRFNPEATDQKKSGFSIGPPRRDGDEEQSEIGEGSHQTIYIVGADNTPKPIRVVTGSTDGRRTQVTGTGLKAGMKVIVGRKAETSAGGASGGNG